MNLELFPCISYQLSGIFGIVGTGKSIPQDLSTPQGCVWYTVVSPTVLCSWESESREKYLVFVSLQLYMQEVV